MIKHLSALAAALALAGPGSALADPTDEAVARYVAWRGGAAFENATGLVMRGTTDDGRFTGEFERRIEPGRLAEHISVGSAVVHRALIGDGGWTVTLSGQVEDAGEASAQEAARRRLTAFDDALSGAHGKVSLEADETLDGKTVQVLRIVFSAHSRYELLLDPASGAMVADRTTEEGSATTTRFEDWRVVEGVRMPFRLVQRMADDLMVTTTMITAIDINPTPDPKAFIRPASRRLHAFADGQARTRPLGFELYAGARILIPATIGGAETQVMLDSGAETTVLDRAFAERLGIRPTGVVAAVGTGGRDVAELASGVTLRLGTLELRDLTVAIMDLKPVAAVLGRPLPAVLGKEVLNALTVQIDFAGRSITFHDPARFQPAVGAVAVPVSNVAGLHAIPASIEGGTPVLMDFDLGNAQPVLVYPSHWKSQGMLADRPTSKILSGAVGGMRTRNVAMLRSVTLAGVTLYDVPAVFGDEDNTAFNLGNTAGNIGMPILSRFELTTDYTRGRLLLRPRPEVLSAPFPKDRVGALTRLVEGVFTVALVAPGSPAEAAGLKVGQKITAVNGRAASQLGVAGFTALRTAPAGQTLTVSLEGGETFTLVLTDYF